MGKRYRVLTTEEEEEYVPSEAIRLFGVQGLRADEDTNWLDLVQFVAPDLVEFFLKQNNRNNGCTEAAPTEGSEE